MTLPTGVHHGIPMDRYLALDAMGAGRLEWLRVSPLHYRYMMDHPEAAPDTEATALGTALHAALLEPRLFAETYVQEPDPVSIAPDNAKPRATKAYREAVADLVAQGKRVLKADDMERIDGMVGSISTHEHAFRLIQRTAGAREVTLLWEQDGRPCRGRIDMLGDRGLMGDLKTARSLKDFSPWTLSKMGYHRQAAWYVDGARRLGLVGDVPPPTWAWLVVENTAPYDVGVFVLPAAELEHAAAENDRLIELLARCESENRWPGMFPNVEQAQLMLSETDYAGIEEAT